MIEVQTDKEDLTKCDVCSLPFQIGETYMSWRLAFGLVAFHIPCGQTFSRQLNGHMKTVRRQLEETGRIEPTELKPYEIGQRRPVNTRIPEFKTRQTEGTRT